MCLENLTIWFMIEEDNRGSKKQTIVHYLTTKTNMVELIFFMMTFPSMIYVNNVMIKHVFLSI
jgi:hypothetical protein